MENKSWTTERTESDKILNGELCFRHVDITEHSVINDASSPFFSIINTKKVYGGTNLILKTLTHVKVER
jgi:hypothetical protein